MNSKGAESKGAFSTLKKDFEFIRKNFFPRWDNKQEWKIKLTKILRGRCDTKRKEIIVNGSYPALIIHEICHAVASPCHGKRFKNRMLKASQMANSLGYPKIEEDVLNDLNTPGFRISHEQVYNEIHDAVIDSPGVTYKDLIRYMAPQYGMYPWEFLKRFKRSESVFKEAKRFVNFIHIQRILRRKGGESA